jgi:hypothetical protein
MKEKDYYIVVKIESAIFVQAENEEEARQIVKNIYEEQHNISLDDSEFVEVQEQPDWSKANE